MENYFNNLNLLKLVFKWKWHLVAIVVIAGILAVIFSGRQFITPKFKATAIVYPSNIEPYTDESKTEQMLQWFNSNDIKSSVIEKFNLGEHYKIDRENEYYRWVLFKEYKENVSISKTKYESVEIEVMDEDPEMVNKMVLAIIEFFNKKVQVIHKEKYIEVLNVAEKQLNRKNNEVDSVKKRLAELNRKFGMLDYTLEVEELTKGYLGTVEGNDINIHNQKVESLRKNYRDKGTEFRWLQYRLASLQNEYQNALNHYQSTLMDVESEFTYTNMVTSPEVPDRKAYPKRWLILLYSVVGAFFMALIVISLIENKHITQALKKKVE